MNEIDSNTETNNQDKKIQQQYQADKENVENFLNHKSPTFNFASLKRLTLSQLSYNGAFKYKRICGFTRKQIVNMTQHPEQYGDYIVKLSRYMMLKSGYYKRLVEYFINMAVINWTVDANIKKAKMYDVKPNTLRSNYIKFTAQVNKFNLDNRVTDIFRKLYVEDACFGFVTENEIETSIFLLEPRYCKINSLVNGNVFEFSINRSLLTSDYYETLPKELQDLIEQSREISLNNLVPIPYEKSFCVKYHNEFTYLYPAFFPLIADILAIEDSKDLSKAKDEADAYKLIYLKIPTNDDEQISMGDEIITPFVEMIKKIVPDGYGVAPSPMPLELIESKSTVSDDNNKVDQAVENYYTEAGVSKALISSASSGSELKLSMKVDSSDIYRLYRQIEAWTNLQMKLRGFIYDSYEFVYSILPTTIFDIDDYIDRQLKLAQASAPVKGRLLAANGVNTSMMLGNSIIENVFQDVFDNWTVLKTSYTQSGDGSDEVGAPTMDETEITEVTEKTRSNDGNDPDNRV